MKTTLLVLALWLSVLSATFAQDIYQGPTPETLFKTPAEQAFSKTFFDKFGQNFDAEAQYKKALTTNIDDWEMALFEARKAQLAFYKTYPGGEFSAGVKSYVEASIRWNYWHLLLAYPIVRANAQLAQPLVVALPSVMLDGFPEAAVTDAAALPAGAYRNFLYYYVAYFNSKGRNWAKYTQNDVSANLTEKANYAREHLTGPPFQYALARLLAENCDKAAPSSVRTLVKELGQTPDANGYVSRVKAHCGEVLSQKDDAPAKNARKADPNAVSFTNLKGEPVTFADFKGKVVYLDVWASWCGPCRAEFPASKQLYDRLSAKQKEKVVFLYISIDDTGAAWKKALGVLQLPGEQGWAPGEAKNKLLQHFGIRSIPRYVLIGKKGNVANADAKRPSSGDAIWQDMLALIEE